MHNSDIGVVIKRINQVGVAVAGGDVYPLKMSQSSVIWNSCLSSRAEAATIPFASTVYPNYLRLTLNNASPSPLDTQVLTIVIQVLVKLMSDKREEIFVI